jgi:hypothetical protein
MKLFALYSSANMRVIKSRRIRLAVHVALWEEEWCIQGVGGANLREGAHFEDRGIDGRIILKWIFEKWNGAWPGLIWLKVGTGGRLF